VGSKHTAAATCLLTKSYSCLRIQALRLTPSNELRPSHATSAAVDYHLRRLNHDSISSTSPQAPLQTNLSTFTPEHSQNGERKGRDRRPVSPTTTTTENRKAQARQHQHNHNHNVTSHPTSPHSVQSQHHFPLHHPHPPVPTPLTLTPQLRPPQMLRHKPHHQSQRPRLRANLHRQSRRERPVHRREPDIRAMRIRAIAVRGRRLH